MKIIIVMTLGNLLNIKLSEQDKIVLKNGYTIKV